ncbi:MULTISPECIES: cyclase family protein [Kitasatospora]|uniref:Putative cyclase n=1 Tax=Kitasatospora setae (strain ATCC 33774 / DSM 43861 / JCM 3304 / KCC A-0304 / NBRC 14216 / KM-6054) TaxID=452652 RepID=E4ND39_KITSK|nr:MULTISPECIES: cyclase family protein [Kitasatospora]BAJ29120.1 putative cyclase [Kitasatospora setae KM-6054]
MAAELVDLTHPVVSGMPVYPGDPEVELRAALTVAGEGVNVLAVHLGSQTGTHVDAPYHLDVRWPTLDGLPLELFTGPAVVVDLRGLPARGEVTEEHLARALAACGPGTVLLLATGWPRYWGTDRYFAHPYLSAGAAAAIVAAGVRTVGIDALSVDPTPDPGPSDPAVASLLAELADEHDPAPEQATLAAHRVLLGPDGGGVIAENLTDLSALLEAQAAGRPVEVSLFPLRLTAADGAPVRAVARLG